MRSIQAVEAQHDRNAARTSASSISPIEARHPYIPPSVPHVAQPFPLLLPLSLSHLTGLHRDRRPIFHSAQGSNKAGTCHKSALSPEVRAFESDKIDHEGCRDFAGRDWPRVGSSVCCDGFDIVVKSCIVEECWRDRGRTMELRGWEMWKTLRATLTREESSAREWRLVNASSYEEA